MVLVSCGCFRVIPPHFARLPLSVAYFQTCSDYCYTKFAQISDAAPKPLILQLALCGKVRRWPPTLAERVGVRGAGVTSHLSSLKRFCEAPPEERLVACCEGVLWWRQEQAGGRRLLLMLITLSSHPLARQRCRVTSNRDIS